jgi:hypothetical protein
MADDLHFEPDHTAPARTKADVVASLSTLKYTKPTDEFSTAPLSPNTIFYLLIIVPHTDTYTLHGPVTSFSYLVPKIKSIVSNSPKAIDKLDALRSIEDVWGDTEPNHEYAERGFGTFIVEGQRGVYTVLQVLREENAAVYAELPSPVYTVTRHGPLIHSVTSASSTTIAKKAKGYVNTSKFVGTFVERKDAKSAAQEAMKEMTEGVEGLKFTENWHEGKGAGVLMAMSPSLVWEVRVGYEDQVLKRAREGSERNGGSVGWRF